MTDARRFLSLATAVLTQVEQLLPPAPSSPDWDNTPAHLWRKTGFNGVFQPVRRVSSLRLDDLMCIDEQKRAIDENTRQFVRGLPANNALLWGPRGTGKSSLIKALLNEHMDQGLRLIEVENQGLTDLFDIADVLYAQPRRFVLYLDDLSFQSTDPAYKALKVFLDGSVSSTPDNVLVYATSNRRHLVPERLSENQDTRLVDAEIHHGEAVEEQISLSERFGLWLAFHPFSQDDYLRIVHHWLTRLEITEDDIPRMERAALQWALAHGSRSGRSAWQFARDWAGQTRLRDERINR